MALAFIHVSNKFNHKSEEVLFACKECENDILGDFEVEKTLD